MNYVYPISHHGAWVTQPFGVPTPDGPHQGIDLGAPRDWDILAMVDGVVSEAVEITWGFGRHVKIKHTQSGGFTSIYGHLSRLNVAAGQPVKAGDVVGGLGGWPDDPFKGNSTNGHLHIEIRNSYGVAVDPFVWLFNQPETTTMSALPLWVDVSRYQGICDFQAMQAGGVRGVAMRANISWGYEDDTFKQNWQWAGDAGLYRTPYHVLYPDQDAQRQVDNWFSTCPAIDSIPRVVDLELERAQTGYLIGERTRQISDLIFAHDEQRPIIYTRYNLANAWLKNWSNAFKNDHYWWLAQYRWNRSLEHPGPPTLPNGVEREQVILHQTADKKAAPAGWISERNLDRDRWQIGDEVIMDAWIEATWGSPEPPPPPVPSSWSTDVDAFLRPLGFNSPYNPPGA